MRNAKHISFEDILDLIKDNFGEGFCKFMIDKDRGLLLGAILYEDDSREEEIIPFGIFS